MRTKILILASLLIVTGCGENGKDTDADTDTDAESKTAPARRIRTDR